MTFQLISFLWGHCHWHSFICFVQISVKNNKISLMDIQKGRKDVTCATPTPTGPLTDPVSLIRKRPFDHCANFKVKNCALFISSCFLSFHLATSTTPATSTTCTATVPPQPQYSYHDINVYSLAGLAPHITLNPTVSNPALAPCPRFLLCGVV